MPLFRRKKKGFFEEGGLFERLLERISGEFERLLQRITANDPSLTNVYLHGKGIGDAGAIRLAEALRGNTHVTKLWLEGNSIGAKGAAALARALCGNSTVTHLNLRRNSIDDEAARALAEAVTRNSNLTELYLCGNNIGDVGGRAILELLQINSSITWLDLGGLDIYSWGNEFDEDLAAKIKELVKINKDAPTPEETRRLKIERRIGWMLDSEDRTQHEAAVSLVLEELDNFPDADRRRGLFEQLLGSTERGVDVAASVDAGTSRFLYWYAAECDAAPVVLMNLLRAHPTLCTCRDRKENLYPFMLLATMSEAGVGDVLEALLLNPSLVNSDISHPNTKGQE